MLTVRFARVGKNKRAQYKIVLQEHTVAPGGRHIEILWSYDPHLKKTTLKEDRIKYWVSVGTTFSDSAYNLMVSKGIISGDRRKVKLPAKKVAEKTEEPASTGGDAESTQGGEKAAEAKAVEAKTEEVKVEEPKAEEVAKTE